MLFSSPDKKPQLHLYKLTFLHIPGCREFSSVPSLCLTYCNRQFGWTVQVRLGDQQGERAGLLGEQACTKELLQQARRWSGTGENVTRGSQELGSSGELFKGESCAGGSCMSRYEAGGQARGCYCHLLLLVSQHALFSTLQAQSSDTSNHLGTSHRNTLWDAHAYRIYH